MNLLIIEEMKRIHPYLEYECIIVNNSFEDFSIPRQKLSFNVTVIIPEVNLGYAKGNNLGIKEAIKNRSSEIVICNPDIVLYSEFISNLLVDLDSYSKLGLYDLAAAYSVRIKGLKPYYNKPSFFGIILPALARYKDFKVNSDMEYKQVYRFHGACFVIPVDNIKHFREYFYPETFLYIEEDLFAHKAEEANLMIFNLPSTEVTHIGGVTTNQSIPWKKYTYYFDGLNLLLNKKYSLPSYICYPISLISVLFRILLEQRSRFSKDK